MLKMLSVVFFMILWANCAIVEKGRKDNVEFHFPFFNGWDYSKEPIPHFGKAMKEKMFTLELESRDLNHGSYGSPPIPVQDSYHYYFKEIQKNPEVFFRYNSPNYFSKVVEDVANYINADKENVVLVESASSGVNSVLRSVKKWNSNDGILYITNEYPMTKNVIYWVAHEFGVKLFPVDIDLPIKNSKYIIEQVSNVLKENDGKISFCVFDSISSTPIFILPAKELLDLCHGYDIPVLFDGAHSIGQQHLDFKTLKPDFFVSNIHKWLLGVQGSAFLYVDQKYHDVIFPAIIGVNNSTLTQRFSWTGTRDWASFLAIPEAIKFRKWLTDEKVWEYNNNLCTQVNACFLDDWNITRTTPPEMTASTTNIEIPCNIEEEKGCYDWSVSKITEILVSEKIFTVIYTFKKRRYLRISCQIYNHIDEYIVLKNRLEQLIGSR